MDDIKQIEAFLQDNIRENKLTLEKKYIQNFEVQEKTLSFLVYGLEHANYNNFNTVSAIWNISGYVNLISYDLKIIGRDLTFAEKDWQKKLYARQAYLLIYESMNDILQLLGKNLRVAISNFADFEIYKLKIQVITSRLNTFKSNYETIIKTVRHTAIGHRDKDMLIQLKSIESIVWYNSIQIVTEFDSILNDLGSVCQELMNRSLDEIE